MKLNTSFKNIFVEIVCYLYVLLFVYAAASKLLDYHDFEIQIGKSPILSSYASFAAIAVVVLELLIAGLLITERLRIIGFHAALSLMTMFSSYIAVLLMWSPYIPCSCGGIISKMSWGQHLIFNLVFVLLAILGLLLNNQHPPLKDAPKKSNLVKRTHSKTFSIVGNILISATIIVFAYFLSEEKIHRNNDFLRRYPHHPVRTLRGIRLPYNSYYVAGYNNGMIYLGNLTNASHVLTIDTTLQRLLPNKIRLQNAENVSFSVPKIHVIDNRFYVADGNTPAIFSGLISKWKANLLWQGTHDFLQLKPVSERNFAISGLDEKNGSISLGTISPDKGIKYSIKLPQHGEGIFENDGILLYNKEIDKVIYVYYYKNEYLLSTVNLDNQTTGKTIDTLQLSTIKIVTEDKGVKRTIGNRAEMIQIQAATSQKRLFVKSKRLGRYEEESMLKQASVIDVYDINKKIYEFSFYLYNYENEEIKSFEIYDNLLVGMSDHYLVLYRLEPHYFKTAND